MASVLVIHAKGLVFNSQRRQGTFFKDHFSQLSLALNFQLEKYLLALLHLT